MIKALLSQQLAVRARVVYATMVAGILLGFLAATQPVLLAQTNVHEYSSHILVPVGAVAQCSKTPPKVALLEEKTAGFYSIRKLLQQARKLSKHDNLKLRRLLKAGRQARRNCVQALSGARQVEPSILLQPLDAGVRAGELVKFSVLALGTSLQYQWLRNGVQIQGANQSSYSLNASPVDAGSYFSVRVFNNLAAVNSRMALLLVSEAGAPPPPRPSASPTATPTVTVTASPTHSAAATASPAPSATFTSLPTISPIPTNTSAATNTATSSPTAIASNTATPTATATGTASHTATYSPSPTPSATFTSTPQATATSALPPISPVLLGHVREIGDIKSVLPLPDGRLFAASRDFGVVSVLNDQNGNLVVGETQMPPAAADRLALMGTDTIITVGSSVLTKVVDISTDVPQVVATIPRSAQNVVVNGHKAYLSGGSYGLSVWDLSNRSNPQEIGNLAGIARDLAIVPGSGIAYLAASTSVKILNISPSNPTVIGEISGEGWFHSVLVDTARQLLILPRQSVTYSFEIYSIQNPSNPIRLSTVPFQPYPNNVSATHGCLNGQHVLGYTPGSIGIILLDLSNPFSPIINRIDRATPPSHIAAFQGGYIYSWGSYLQQVASNSTSQIRRLDSLKGDVSDVEVSGDLALVVKQQGQSLLIGIQDKQRPEILSKLQISGGGAALRGNLALVASAGGVRQFDISNPVAPVGSLIAGTTFSKDVTFAGDQVAYAASATAGLTVLFIDSNGAILHSIIDTPGNAEKVSVSPNRQLLAVADGANGVLLFNIGNQLYPVQIARIPPQGLETSMQVALTDNVLIQGVNTNITRLYDITNPNAPSLLQTISNPSGAYNGRFPNRLYDHRLLPVLNSNVGSNLFEQTYPLHQYQQLGTIAPFGAAGSSIPMATTIKDNFMYVAENAAPLVVYRVFE